MSGVSGKCVAVKEKGWDAGQIHHFKGQACICRRQLYDGAGMLWNGDPYERLVRLMRREGARENAVDMEFGKVESIKPMRVTVGGVLLTKGLCRIDGAALREGDMIAVKRIGEKNLIMGKVMEL